VALFPVVLVLHIALAIALLLPSVLLPFLIRRARIDIESERPTGGLVSFLIALQGSGSVLIGLGVGTTGIALLVMLGLELLEQPWLLVALTLYAANLLVAALIARPNIRRLLRRRDEDPERWRRLARRQRYVAYGMAAAIGVIGLLMSTKPELW
jgi:hypothetical protein